MGRNKFDRNQHFTDLFDVFKQERKGILYFALCLIFLTILNYSMQYWVSAPEIDTSQLDSLIALTENIQTRKKSVISKQVDINSNDTLGWLSLGFSKKQVNAIFNYRLALGGRFNSIDQIKKVYILDSTQYVRIKPHLIDTTTYAESGTTEAHNSNKVKQDEKQPILFRFDPNVISIDSLLLLGFHPKQAISLIKYREKISKYNTPEDLLKLYLYSAKDHEIYKDFIHIDTVRILQVDKEVRDSVHWKSTARKIELNTADTSDLVALYGIGRYSASRIIWYRLKLGGFYSVEQLHEIRGLKKETIDNLSSSFMVDTFYINKIKINTCTFNKLLAHPYFDFYETKLIINYRDEKGKFVSLRDLKKLELLPDAFIKKVGHYLSFE